MTRVIMQASRFAARGLCDHDAKYTMFAQLMHQAHYRGANALRCSGQAWSAQFRGEGSIDAGGPYRESITNVSAELQSTALPLLVQCPNFNNDACVLAWCTLTPPPPPPVQHYPHTRIPSRRACPDCGPPTNHGHSSRVSPASRAHAGV